MKINHSCLEILSHKCLASEQIKENYTLKRITKLPQLQKWPKMNQNIQNELF